MVFNYLTKDERFNTPETRNVKCTISSRELYGDSAIGYVCLQRVNSDLVDTLGKHRDQLRTLGRPVDAWDDWRKGVTDTDTVSARIFHHAYRLPWQPVQNGGGLLVEISRATRPAITERSAPSYATSSSSPRNCAQCHGDH
ncbi:unnamed protein product [Trichogramma brassicae]|uniref:Uncharacterized protein n=1 Tax=Trichogramma brassicae TaxID=86971 RepID=A0A6H5J3P5_9HYME|nr:unnamed protein product [Trichogramma brassicae]